MHCHEDFDDRFNCVTPEHKQNLLTVVEALLLAQSGAYKWFVVPENKLRKYTTLKADSDKKKFKRPDDDTIDFNHKAPEANFTFAAIEGAV